MDWDAGMSSPAGEALSHCGCSRCTHCCFWQLDLIPLGCGIRLSNLRSAIADSDAGSGLSLPSVPGSIPGVAEEGLLLAEAAEGAKQSHRGEQRSGTC